MSLIKYAIFVGLGVMLGITLVDMSVGSESTIRSFLWDLF
jgi:hypothetical protein